jgi:phosphonoacetaldehyde hydrolase
MANQDEGDMAGKLKAVVFDWAGTVIDFGSFAPMGVFVETFRRFDVPVSIDDARKPMGLPKRAHIAAMMAEPHIAAAWTKAHGAPPDEAAIDRVYDVFVPLNVETVAKYSDLIPGTADMVRELRARGLKIGSTTGYTRSIMERVLPLAAAQGYAPDNLVCADDMPLGRPTPMGMYRCFLDLQVFPASVVVKVDDTEPGIAEGVAAGCITVGVTLSGNDAGLTLDQYEQLPKSERAKVAKRVGAKLKAAGANYVIDTVADLPALIDKIESKSAKKSAT